MIARNGAAAPAVVTNAVAASTPDSRLADLTARLRADNARLAERAQKLEAPAPVQQAAPAPAAAPQQRSSSSVERAALAAIAAAVAPEAPLQSASYGDVTVRPIAQKPTLFPDHHEAARAESEDQAALPETFIPQAAERPPTRSPRMPKFEDLPMPAQAEIRQARGEAEEDHPQKTRLSLLQRLANVGLGRRDEETEPPIAARASGPAMSPLPERKPQRSVAQQMGNEPVSEYARRPAPQGLDVHGRPAPVAAAPQGDDHLDIPAFLRRQSN
jgi:cell division protein FtsZ